jgi:DNA invertase Pin-like site-specific DNA recombinase
MKAIAYLRVSTDEQSENGVSLAAQEAKVRAYCELYNIELVDVVSDPGESGKSLERPGIKAALKRLENGEADGLVVAKLDRLSRSVGDWDFLIAEYFGERARPACLLWSVGEQIDTRTAPGRLVLNVLMSVAQWERETIGERTRAALQYKKGRGERVGTIAYGFELDADGVHLVACPAEQAVLAAIRDLRAAGRTLTSIATELNDRGIKRRGNGRWDHGFLSRLLSRPEAA